MIKKPVFIINPKSNSGRTLKKIDEFKEKIANSFSNSRILLTEYGGHGTLLAREELKAGADLVVAVGGDGTANEVLNGFFENGKLLNRTAHFSVVMCGTGCDFRRTLEWPKEFDLQLERIKKGVSQTIDVGHIEATNPDGSPLSRYFLNEASVGLSGEIARRVWEKKGKKNKFAYMIETISSLHSHHPYSFEIETEHGKLNLKNASFLIFANGSFFGGGMNIAPNASLSDGLAEIISIENVTFAMAISNAHLLYTGKHLSLPQAHHLQARRLEIGEGDKRLVSIETDGEPCGFLPASMSIVETTLPILR